MVALNDYKVSVKGKERIYHGNLLKRYFERENSVPVGAVCVEVNTTNSKNEHVKGEVEVDPVDYVNFLEIGGYVAKASVKDVAIGKLDLGLVSAGSNGIEPKASLCGDNLGSMFHSVGCLFHAKSCCLSDREKIVLC